MDPVKIGQQRGPEWYIQKDLVMFLRARNWRVTETHGSPMQMGVPDLWAAHLYWGYRWIEVKNPLSYKFTPAQKVWIPEMAGVGVKIYVMTEASEAQYEILTKGSPNWMHYFK